jgi:F-type H+-transporting ATPase subunit a
VTHVVAAAEWGGEFDGVLDDINALFDFPAIWDLSLFGVDLSINRTILIAWFMTLLCATIFLLAFRSPRVVPSKIQSVGELVIDFVRQIAIDIIGPKGLKFVPLLTTFFVFVFFMNVAKITPFLMLPPTSRVAFPLFLAGSPGSSTSASGSRSRVSCTTSRSWHSRPGCPRSCTSS